jgi:hypothetical protein
VLGDNKLCTYICAVHQAYACATFAGKILQVLHECSLSSVIERWSYEQWVRVRAPKE